MRVAAAVERAIERIAASGAPPSIAAAVKRAIERIAASGAPSSTSDAALGGTWRLLWSARSSKFSPLLGLPKPLRPESQQQFGAVAAERGDTAPKTSRDFQVVAEIIQHPKGARTADWGEREREVSFFGRERESEAVARSRQHLGWWVRVG